MSVESTVAEAVRQSRVVNQIPDVLPETDLHSLCDLMREAVKKHPDSPAYQCLSHKLSFRDLDRLSDHFASFLQHHLQLPLGTHVALHMPNLLQYPVAALGVLKAGMVLVNTNPLYTREELLHQFEDGEVKVVVTLANIAKPLESMADQIPGLQVVVTEVGDLHPPLKRLLINGVLRYVRREVPTLTFPRSITFRAAMRVGASVPCTPHKPQSDDLALLQYTGGTTGVAKGAMLTHGSLVACARQCAWFYEVAGLTQGKMTVVVPLPLYHIYAFNVGFSHILYQGNCALLITNPRDIKGFLKELKHNRFNAMFGLNTLYNAMLNHPDFQKIDFSSLLLSVSGGMPLSSKLAERWKAATGSQILEGYGLTESSGILCFNPPDKPRIGTVGVGFSSCEFKIEDEEGNSLGVNQEGELCFRGAQMMKGYWKRPKETQELMDSDGFLKTGDIATISEDGYVRICDRKKDMIIVSGFKIFPSEVEDVVMAHNGIRECAVVGEPDDEGNEKVVLYVVKSQESLSEEEIIAYCREHLTAYKIPKKVVFMQDLPKSNVGKVLRRELRARKPLGTPLA